MENLYPRLQQLRLELEDSASSPENGLSLLYAIRREVLRHYDALPFAQLLLCPPQLKAHFYQAQEHLGQAPAFPMPSASVQYVGTEQALRVLERVVLCKGKQRLLGA